MRAIHRLLVMIPLIVASISYSFGIEIAPNDVNFEEARERTMMENTFDSAIDDTDSPYPSKNVDRFWPESKTFNKRGIADFLFSNKRMNLLMNKVNDDGKSSGSASLSIVSPLEALQRKVVVMYNTRQREKNRGYLNNYGKRSVSLHPRFPQQNEFLSAFELKNSKSKEISDYPLYIQSGRLYGQIE